ncbi:MAG TPA: VanZ family protein [Mucilaginibacter sp.]|nr:VanZ family protein [Mucilaginibacter sp.]
MKKGVRYQRLTILWALFIFILCSVPFGSVSNSPMFFPGFDKLTHCGLFFVLAIFWGNGVIRQQNIKFLSYKSAVVIFAGCLVYGGLIEILQLTIFTWRSGEWGDFFSDAVGAGMAVFSILVIERALGHEKV